MMGLTTQKTRLSFFEYDKYSEEMDVSTQLNLWYVPLSNYVAHMKYFKLRVAARTKFSF